MIDIGSLEFTELLNESERLRREGDVVGAATLMAGKYGEMTVDCLRVACRHAARITQEGGLKELAEQHAKELAKIDPSDPLVQQILHAHRRHHKEGQGGLNETAKGA